jgi:putative ABC transport system permease protein
MFGLIFKNILHRPVRNGALLLSFAFIAASLFTGHYLIGGATDSVKSGISRLGADLIVVPTNYSSQSEAVILRGEPSTFYFDSTVVSKIRSTDGVADASPQIFIASSSESCCSLPIQIIAFDPKSDFTIIPWLSEKLERPLGKNEIVVGSDITEDIGSSLVFFGHAFTIAGRLEPTGTGVDTSVFIQTEDALIMAEESKVYALELLDIPEDGVSAILVRVENTSEKNNVASRILADVPGTQVLTTTSLISSVSDQLLSTTRILDLAAMVATLISMPLIALISAMAANERQREMGVLRALGATRGKIFLLILCESVFLAASGGILGIGVSWTILLLFQDYIAQLSNIPMSVPAFGSLLPIIGFALFTSITAGGLASLYPALRSAMMEPYKALRSGEI